MRPVSDEFGVTQAFGSYATGGVTPDPNGTEVQQLVAQYGNYQPYGHAGQDIGAPIGTPVHAIAAGTVLWADWGTNLPGDESDAGYRERWYLYKTFPGIVIVIQHDGWKGVYAHLSETPLNPGDTVTEGQQIALSGNTRAPGVTLGAHLHVEALIDDSYTTGNGLIYGRTDPTPYFGAGSINFQSVPTAAEQDVFDIMTATPEEQDAFIQRFLDHLVTQADGNKASLGSLLQEYRQQHLDIVKQTTRPTINPSQAEDIVAAVTARVPNAVLNAKFTLPDGTVTNLAGILTAINAKPVSGGTVTNVAADPQAIADAIVNGINIQIVKK